MNEHSFELTIIENNKQVEVCVIEYKNGEQIIHHVAQPSIHTDSETVNTIKNYINLYNGFKEEQKEKALNLILEKIQFHEWENAALAVIAAYEAENGITHNKTENEVK